MQCLSYRALSNETHPEATETGSEIRRRCVIESNARPASDRGAHCLAAPGACGQHMLPERTLRASRRPRTMPGEW
eukprot:525123-Alexandrium_andersonii.AAC.2